MTAARQGPVPAYFGPRGFRWLWPGQLGGAARPGLFVPIEQDLAALERVGTRLLVSLTEEWEPEPALLRDFGIDSLHLPIPDRGAPTVAEAWSLCGTAAARLARGEAVVYHCRAGKGRTGTMLAAQVLHAAVRDAGTSGDALARDAASAILRVRAANPYWIESDEQVAMLHAFAAAARAWQGGPATGPG